MKLAAITGSIGCGKTTLANIVRSLGYVVWDVDKWSRQLYFQADYIEKIAKAFPGVVEENKVNKKKLRQIVFNDNKKLKLLESISHPFLKKRLLNSIFKNRFSEDIFFIDAALLFEAGWDKYCDMVIVADVDYDAQKQRVMLRDGISAEEFEKINQAQMSNKEKILRGDVIIETDKAKNLLAVELLSIIDELEEN